MKNLLSLTGLKIAIFIGVCHFRMGGTSMTVKIIKSYFVLESELWMTWGFFSLIVVMGYLICCQTLIQN